MRIKALIGIILLLPFTSFANDDAKQLPNIVYILADDMGYGDVSALNPGSRFKTPGLDKLAHEGMYFSDAHSGSSVCTPTRYGILTGRYCWRTKLKKGVLFNYDNSLMESTRLNVASYLKQNGYKTAMIGKWHLGLDWASQSKPGEFTSAEKDVDFTKPFRNGPVDMGFDYFLGINASLDMPPYILLENDKALTIPTVYAGKEFGRHGLADKDLKPDDFLPAFTKAAVKYIEGQDQKTPFFLYFSLNAPHTPIAPSAEFKGKSQLKGKLGKYADFCMEVDDTVGQILTALKNTGLDENTLVIFTADNGCPAYIGAKDFEMAKHFPNFIYRGYKGGTYDGGHRIPFLVRWPNTIKAKSKNDQPICLTDLLATCAEIVGKPLPENAGEDSLSFLSAMGGNSIDTSKRQAVVHHDMEGNFAIRKGKWKFIDKVTLGLTVSFKPPLPLEQQKGHLYDMESDPSEKSNVAAEHPEVVKELTDLLEKYRKDGRSVNWIEPK